MTKRRVYKTVRELRKLREMGERFGVGRASIGTFADESVDRDRRRARRVLENNLYSTDS